MLPNTSLILELSYDELKKLITHLIEMISLQLLIQHICDCSSSSPALFELFPSIVSLPSALTSLPSTNSVLKLTK
ncbi:hypothetical protein Tco_1480134, partial [Tanacetum coccineum]